MKTVLIMATTAAMIEQFNKNNICLLRQLGYKVHVAGNWRQGNPISEERLEQFKEWLDKNQVEWFHIPATRKPTDIINNRNAYREILRLIKQYQYEFIHCHTPIGSVVARLAGHKTKTKVIYTAHGFHFYKGAPYKNWILYYLVEKILSKWTDLLIVINKEDYELAKRKFKTKRLVYIPGVGIDIDKYKYNEKVRESIRREYGILPSQKLLLSVGEVNKNKNQKLTIEAMAQIVDADIKYIICGEGKLKENIYNFAKELGIENQVIFTGYREDVYKFYSAADVFIFPSFREGLSVALMEAMACELPCIASRIRGNIDLLENSQLLFESNNVFDLKDKILRALNVEIREREINNNKNNLQKYKLDNVSEMMKRVYQSLNASNQD